MIISYPSGIFPQSQIDDIINRAGTNGDNLINIVNTAADDQADRIVWLLNNLPDLDLLEIDSSIIYHNDYYSNLSKNSELNDSIYLKYIYYLRIDQEPLSDYKPLIYGYFQTIYKHLNPDRELFVRFVNKWIADSISVHPVEFYGPLKSVVQIFQQRTATERERVILYSAIMKSFGIPSRFVYIPVSTKGILNYRWIEVYIDGNWIPVYLDRPDLSGNFNYPDDTVGVSIVVALNPDGFDLITDRYTSAGMVTFKIINGFPHYDNFSINLLGEGMLRPLDELQTELDSLGYFSCTLGEGKYFLVLGNRNDQGSSQVKISVFSTYPSDTMFLENEIPLEIPTSGMDSSVLEYSIPSSLDSMEGKILIFRGSPDQEASIRVWNQIRHYSSEIPLYTIGGFRPEEILTVDDFSELLQEPLPLPVIIGIDDHKIVMLHFGFNLNYDDIIAKWLY